MVMKWEVFFQSSLITPYIPLRDMTVIAGEGCERGAEESTVSMAGRNSQRVRERQAADEFGGQVCLPLSMKYITQVHLGLVLYNIVEA